MKPILHPHDGRGEGIIRRDDAEGHLVGSFAALLFLVWGDLQFERCLALEVLRLVGCRGRHEDWNRTHALALLKSNLEAVTARRLRIPTVAWVLSHVVFDHATLGGEVTEKLGMSR